MRTLTKIGNQAFSLIELMVVVAIIGILASVAVPQYSKFQNKAKQSEAKVALGAIYTVEKAYFVEANSYSSCLANIGYSPSGTYRYNHGFNTGILTILPGSGTCTAGTGVSWFNAGSATTGGGVNANHTSTATAFTAGATAALAGTDVWQINQAQALTNPNSGI